jgi:GNAT superfamily N-acetyltransferase
MKTGETSEAPRWTSYSARELLRGGREMTIRAINPSDREALREHFASLSVESRYLRFFGARNLLTPQELSRLTELDFAGSAGLVAIESDDGRERIVGVAHYLDTGVPGHAEFACDVADDYRDLGIATVLLEHLAGIARTNGITEFDADVMGSNRRMLKVFSDIGFETRQSNVAGVVHFILKTCESEKHRRAHEKRSLG